MPLSTTMTIRVSAAEKAKLDRIAVDTRRSRSFLDGVKRGLADMEAGRLIPHKEAMAEIYAAIDAVGAGGGQTPGHRRGAR